MFFKFYQAKIFNNKMKINIIKIVAIVLILMGSTFSCKNDDFNIENLYAQPLPVIQKCVQGKWKWIETYGLCGVFATKPPSNTIVNITKDSVVTTGDNDALNQACTFSYRWEKDSVQWGYTTFVMWNNEKNKGEWYFDKIQNDSLYIHDFTLGPCGYILSYLFKRIN